MELYLALNLGSNREVPHVLDYPTQSEGISLLGDSANSSELYLTLEPSGDFALRGASLGNNTSQSHFFYKYMSTLG